MDFGYRPVHAFAFELEKAHGPAFGDEGEGRLVFMGDFLVTDANPLVFLNLAQAKGNEGEIGEAEKVEFQEALRLEVVLVELLDEADWVLVDGGYDLGKRGVVQDDARGMEAALAGEALDLGREGYEVLEIRISAHDALERGVVLVIPGEVVTGIGA